MFDHLYCNIYGLALWILKAYATFRVMKFLYIVVMSIKGHFFTKPMDLKDYLDKWTVVTGCTDGIGKAYVEELAATRGLRYFYLIGRNPKKLSDISTELINCAGIAPQRVDNFIDLPIGLSSKILRVNLMSAVKMVELILPGMIKRNTGIIVTISSITGWRPLPYMSTYPASKAALSFFSDSLADEFHGTNVKIQCLIPLLVATKVASYEVTEANNIFVIDPKSFARQAVRLIGNFRLSSDLDAFQDLCSILFYHGAPLSLYIQTMGTLLLFFNCGTVLYWPLQ